MLAEVQRGYKLHDRVLRPAMVVVGKGSGETKEETKEEKEGNGKPEQASEKQGESEQGTADSGQGAEESGP